MQCACDGCNRDAVSKSLCSMHYQRQKRGLDIGTSGRLIATPILHAQALNEALRGGIDCILWPFGRDGYGYGCVTNNGKKDRAHRAQWERAHKKSVPDGMVVRHSCDCQTCINPDHLILGTQADNIRDQAEHGRKAMGSTKGGAKLTESIVSSAREKAAQGTSIANLAAEYGVHPGTMAQACRRDTWRHVA